MPRAQPPRQAGAVRNAAICIIAEKLKDYFGGGFTGERVIRNSEAEMIATTIWEKLERLLAEDL